MTKELCTLCHEEPADTSCVACEKEICYACDSGYYSDENLCKDCFAHMTPEEIESDRIEQERYDKESSQ
jgi:hypothetical protein